MIKLSEGGAYLLNGVDVIEDNAQSAGELQARLGGNVPSKEEAARNTMAYNILKSHNTSDNMDKLKIKFDKMTSHDITFVGIIQTARASGLEKFPIPYVLTNCHNSLCAVGGTINEDDHMFGLTCAKKYGGIYVPPHQAVIHQFAREMLAEGGKMILGSDSHTRYGALGTMAMGEGGPELVKQLLNKTYDINMPGVVAIYMTGAPAKGVGPQDVALAIIGAVFGNGYVKNKVMEFVGPGISNLSADFRIGIDVMTTETTCLSSIWRTDDKIKEFYDIHGRSESYKEINPGAVTYYDGVVYVELDKVKPMIAMPFHPSNTYTIEELNANLEDILHDCEKKALVSLDGQVDFKLVDKIRDGKLYVDQGIIAGCAGGGRVRGSCGRGVRHWVPRGAQRPGCGRDGSRQPRPGAPRGARSAQRDGMRRLPRRPADLPRGRHADIHLPEAGAFARAVRRVLRTRHGDRHWDAAVCGDAVCRTARRLGHFRDAAAAAGGKQQRQLWPGAVRMRVVRDGGRCGAGGHRRAAQRLRTGAIGGAGHAVSDLGGDAVGAGIFTVPAGRHGGGMRRAGSSGRGAVRLRRRDGRLRRSDAGGAAGARRRADGN